MLILPILLTSWNNWMPRWLPMYVTQHYLKTLPCHELKTLTHAQKFGLYSVFETDARILQWVCLMVFSSVIWHMLILCIEVWQWIYSTFHDLDKMYPLAIITFFTLKFKIDHQESYLHLKCDSKEEEESQKCF